MFKGIKLFIGRYYLNQKLKNLPKRNRRYISIFQAKSIGVIYDATHRMNYDKVKEFIHYLKESQKKVIVLGFINSKDPNQMLAAMLQFRYFGQADLNWFMKPQGNEVENFVNQEFDILIDLSLDYSFPLNYICRLSRAKFKVGRTQENGTKYYDMLIDVSRKKTTEYFIIQVKHYLKLINEKNEF